MLCSCNKPTYSFTDLNTNTVVHKCSTTKTQYADLKEDKKLGYVLIESEKVGKPCDFLKIIKLSSSGRQLKIPLQFHDTPRSKVEPNFYYSVKTAYDRASNIGEHSPLTWGVISTLDRYAKNNLLIEPWKQRQESFSEYLRRFREAEWVDKNWVLRQAKYKDWLRRKKAKLDNIEQSTEIFHGMPVLQKKIRRSLKKELKKKEKIVSKNVEYRAYQNAEFVQETVFDPDADFEANPFNEADPDDDEGSSKASEPSEEFSVCDEGSEDGEIDCDEGEPGEELEFSGFNE